MVRRSTIFPSLLTSALALAVPAVAYAQAAAPAAEMADEADTLFRKANEAFKAQKWQDAIGLYERAFAKKKAHDIAANLAYAELKVGRTAQAAQHLAYAVRTWPPTGKADNRRIAAERLEQIKKELAVLAVQVNMAGAEISINGKLAGVSPLEDKVFAAPGTVTIEAKRSGYKPAKQVVPAEKGSEHSVAVALVALPEQVSAAPPEKSNGTTTEKPDDTPAAGTIGAGANAKSNDMPIQKGNPPANNTSSQRRAILIAGGGATISLALGSLAFFTVGRVKANQKDEAQAQIAKQGGPSACITGSYTTKCEEVYALRDAEHLYNNISFWTFMACGAAGAATTIYGFVAPKAAPTSRVMIAPIVTASGGGVTITGAW